MIHRHQHLVCWDFSAHENCKTTETKCSTASGSSYYYTRRRFAQYLCYIARSIKHYFV